MKLVKKCKYDRRMDAISQPFGLKKLKQVEIPLKLNYSIKEIIWEMNRI